MCLSRTSCAPTARQRPKSDYPLATSRACARTIGLRIRTSRHGGASARCSASNRPDQPNASCPFTPPSTTPSTSSVISHPVARSAPSERKLSRRGEPPPPPESELGFPIFVRPNSVRVTAPSRQLFPSLRFCTGVLLFLNSQLAFRTTKRASAVLLVSGSPGPLHVESCSGGIDLAHVLRSELDRRRGEVFVQPLHPARAGDRHDPGLLSQEPSDRDLSRRRIFLSGDALQQIDDGLVGLHRLRPEARELAAGVGFLECRAGIDLAREEALPERAPRNETDSEAFASRQHLCFRIAHPQRIFALEGCNRLNIMRPPHGLRAGFGQPEIFDLAFRNKVLHRAGDVLDRHVGVDAMLVEEVDTVRAEALQ